MVNAFVRSLDVARGSGATHPMSVLLAALLSLGLLACGSDPTPIVGSDQPDDPEELGNLAGTWAPAPALPVAVQAAGVAAYRGQIYVAGGEGIVNVPNAGSLCCGSYASVQRFDPASNTWEVLGDLPEARDEMALGVVGDTLYAVGGRLVQVGQPGGTKATLWAYLPDTDEWVERPELPAPRRGASAVGAIGFLFVIGGEGPDGRVSGDSIAVYDPITSRWIHSAPVPGGVVNASTHFFDDLIYVVGGYVPGSLGAASLRTITAYEPSGAFWFTITDAPGSDDLFGSAVLGGRLHLVGGRGGGFAPSELHLAYEFSTDKWYEAPDLRDARRDHAAVTVGDRLYVLTGNTAPDLDPSTTMEFYQLN